MVESNKMKLPFTNLNNNNYNNNNKNNNSNNNQGTAPSHAEWNLL